MLLGGGGAVSVAWGPDFGGPDGDQFKVAANITELSAALTFTDWVVLKDSWYETIGLGNDNHNGEPLQVEGVAATKKRAIIGWDTAAQPSGVSVSAATLRLVVHTPPVGALNVAVDVYLIPTGSEGWTETGVTRTNAPATDGALVASFTVLATLNGGAAGLVHTVSLDATARTRLGANMGVRSYSLILDSPAVAAVNLAFWDKDTGILADRPKLSFTASKVLV